MGRGGGTPPATRWTARSIASALRAPDFDVAAPGFVEACIACFGSVTAARSAAAKRTRVWTKAMVISERQARAGRGLVGVGGLVRAPAIRLFGSTDAALAAAARRSAGG